ncbi:MAG: hypothetical protein ACI849_001124 [Patiriisocius sp.]
MKIWARIGQLSIGQLVKLSLLFLSRPQFSIPTLSATKKTMHICDALYGNTHHKSNQANAFRHALWNILICQNVMKYAKNKQKSVFWTQKVGDLYEKVTQNELLDEAMDLHNNTIGRIFFLNHIDKNEEEMIHLLQEMAKKAQKVAKIEEIDYFQNVLVYLEE